MVESLEKEGKASGSKSLIDPTAALTRAFLHANAVLEQRHPAWSEAGGTTAACVYFLGRRLWIANCGDSRVVVGRRRESGGSLTDGGGAFDAKDLSVDQTPDLPDEKQRILEAGGWVAKDGGSEARVWLSEDMSSAGLSMTRSLGDRDFKAVGVTAEPVVTEYSIKSKDAFLISASDGIWSVLTSAEAVEIVAGVARRHPGGQQHCSRAAQELVTTAARKWKEDEGDYRDDITAVVFSLLPNSTLVEAGDRGAPDHLAAGEVSGVDDEANIKDRIRRRIEKRKQQQQQQDRGKVGDKEGESSSFAERKQLQRASAAR